MRTQASEAASEQWTLAHYCRVSSSTSMPLLVNDLHAPGARLEAESGSCDPSFAADTSTIAVDLPCSPETFSRHSFRATASIALTIAR